MKLVFATANANKVREIRNLIPERIDLVGLEEIGCFTDIPETGSTIESKDRKSVV